MKCRICNTEIVLVPSAAERARNLGTVYRARQVRYSRTCTAYGEPNSRALPKTRNRYQSSCSVTFKLNGKKEIHYEPYIKRLPTHSYIKTRNN
jgi:hypothetical protein